MSDTLTFTETIAVERWQEPRLSPRTLLEHIPRSNVTRQVDLGSAGWPTNIICVIQENTADLALATLATWEAMEGDNGTLTATISSTNYSCTYCTLLAVRKFSRASKNIRVQLTFQKLKD